MIVVLTYIPSPYQVEYFDALAAAMPEGLRVIYLTRAAPDRQWSRGRLEHPHCILGEDGAAAADWVREAELVVFGDYQRPAARALIDARRATGRPWAFWGERPGARFRGWAGRVFRALRQRRLRNARAPVWGIGEWAVEGYKAELGGDRLFVNVPYFSNLDGYFAINRGRTFPAPVRFLFSGSLISRKGADLLANAFMGLVASGVGATLTFVGSGPLEAGLRAATSGCRDRVEFLGFREWRELPGHYANGDVLCAPSRYDGWGLIVPEGLAAGMPVISTDRTGAARELVTPENGWLIPADDGEALASAMRAAASLPRERRAEMSALARVAARRQNLDAGVDRFRAAVELTRDDWAHAPRSVENQARAS